MTESAGDAKKCKTSETQPIPETEVPLVVVEDTQAAQPETDDFSKEEEDKKSVLSTVAITDSGDEQEKDSTVTQELFSAIPSD